MDQAAIDHIEQQIDGEAKNASPARCGGSRCCNTAMTR